MNMPRAAIAILLTLPMAAAVLAHAGEIPEVFPRFDTLQADSALVVARVSPGAPLPALEECTQADAICLHSPFWFHAQVVTTVSGHAAAPELFVSTLSHYGMTAFAADPAPRLLNLQTFQGRARMPINAWTSLAEQRDGELFLVDYGYPWPAWLPCATPQLRQALDASAFPPTLIVKPDDLRHEGVEQHPDLYSVSPAGAVPRYGVSITHLRALIAKLSAAGAPVSCPRHDD